MMENEYPVVTALEPEWRNPDVDPPPRGSTIWMLTRGGIGVRGTWSDDGSYLAWSPMPAMPQWLKDKLHRAYGAPVPNALPAAEQQ